MVRVRHCIECPKCRTRYLPGLSPYANGSYLMPKAVSGWILYCSCGTPPASSRWEDDDLRRYVVSPKAHDRGYGTPDEILNWRL